MKSKLQNYSRRVDVQVSVLSAAMVVSACLCLAIFIYNYTYNTMITSLKERTESVYEYLESVVSVDTFEEINEKADNQSDIYIAQKNKLEDIRIITHLRYLYTAKMNDNGTFIYLVDGLEESSSDFRYPGDLIEEETIPDLTRALNGEIIHPNKILNTSWGKIFIAYFPVKNPDTGDIMGVVGMEFDASKEYHAYQNVFWITLIVIIIMLFFSFILASKMFKRLSNPKIQDLYNTDQLTQLKSRNAFEFDMKNAQEMKNHTNLGIIIMDLDYLKNINDVHGHEMGDLYISETAALIRNLSDDNTWAYRIGGDEFAVFMRQKNITEMKSWVKEFENQFIDIVKQKFPKAGISIGMMLNTKDSVLTMQELYKLADKNMYCNKKEHRLNCINNTQY